MLLNLATSNVSLDMSGPRLLSFSLDMSSKTVVLTFSEAVEPSTVNVTAIIIQSSRGVFNDLYYRLTSARSVTTMNMIVTIVLSEVDFDGLQMRPLLASMQSNTYMSVDPTVVSDLSFNLAQHISNADAILVSDFTPDTVPPEIVNYSLNLADNSMALTFSEPVVVSTFNVTHLIMESSMDPTSRTSYSLTGGSVHQSMLSASRIVSFTLANQDIVFLKTNTSIATGFSSTFLSALSGLVADVNFNFNVATAGLQPSNFTDDTSRPTLVAFGLDVDSGVLTLSFDDAIEGSLLNTTAIVLQNARTRQPGGWYRISDVIPSPNAFIMYVHLGSHDLNMLKQTRDLCTDTGNCYITVDWTIALDLNFNFAFPIVDGMALAISSFIEDTTGPFLVSWTLDMDMGLVSLAFDEPVDITTFQVDQLTLQDDAGGGISYSLTGSNGLTPNDTSELFNIRLTTDDLNNIKAITTLATSDSNTFLSFGMSMISDLNLNPVFPVPASSAILVSVFFTDLTPPSLLSFSANFYIGILSLTFDETVHVNTLDISAITLVNEPSPSPSSTYTLTGSTPSISNSAVILINLSEGDHSGLRSRNDLATSVSDTYLSVTLGTIEDMNANPLTPIPPPVALRAMYYVNSPILVSFELSNYTVNEGEMLAITVTLNTTTASEISFDIATEDIEATG